MSEETQIFEALRLCIERAKTPDEALKNIQKSLGGRNIYVPCQPTSEKYEEIRQYYNQTLSCSATIKHFNIGIATFYRALKTR